MGNKHCILALVCIVNSVCFCYGQEVSPNKYRFATGISYTSNQINFPFTKRISEKHHSGFSVDFQFEKQRDRIFQFNHGFSIAYQNHQELFDAVYLKYKPTISFEIKQVFRLDIPFGLGYAHSFPTEKGYSFDNGGYVPSKPKGKSHFVPSIGIGVSIHLEKITKTPLSFYSHYEISAFAPYASDAGLPFIPFTSINSGIKYHF